MGPPGHFAIGLAVKPAAKVLPLWVLLLATELLDLLSYGFQAVGIEDFGVIQMDFQQGIQIIRPGSIPWSHGFFMSIVWSIAASVIIFIIYRDSRSSCIIGLLVFSHWILDFIVHPADLPLLFNGSPMLGLGLWSSGTGFSISVILEISMLVSGLGIYLAARKNKGIPSQG